MGKLESEMAGLISAQQGLTAPPAPGAPPSISRARATGRWSIKHSTTALTISNTKALDLINANGSGLLYQIWLRLSTNDVNLAFFVDGQDASATVDEIFNFQRVNIGVNNDFRLTYYSTVSGSVEYDLLFESINGLPYFNSLKFSIFNTSTSGIQLLGYRYKFLEVK